MYIRNIKTGLRQECHNADVIRMCQKDAENYEVCDIYGQMDAMPEKPKDFDKMSAAELKAVAKENGIEGASSLTKGELLELLKG